jgi:hypothetical protein
MTDSTLTVLQIMKVDARAFVEEYQAPPPVAAAVS